MGKKRKNIQGSKLSFVVFDANINKIKNIFDNKETLFSIPKDPVKFISTLEVIRKEDELRKKWNSLHSWHNLNHKTDKINFFRVHCLIRNPEAQNRIKELENRSLEDRRKINILQYTIKEWSIEYSDIVKYSLGLTEKEYGPPGPNRHFILASSRTENKDTSVLEMFQETPLLNLEQVIQKDKESFLKKQIPISDFSSWGLINQDIQYNEPVIYLRIDLNKYSIKTKDKIDKLIRAKKHKAHTEHIDFDSIETALMLHDLQNYYSKKDILFFIESAIYDTNDTPEVDSQTVRDYLDKAKALIKSSTSKMFPLFK